MILSISFSLSIFTVCDFFSFNFKIIIPPAVTKGVDNSLRSKFIIICLILSDI